MEDIELFSHKEFTEEAYDSLLAYIDRLLEECDRSIAEADALIAEAKALTVIRPSV